MLFDPFLQRVRCFKMKLLCNKLNVTIIGFFLFLDKQIQILFLEIQIVMVTIKTILKLFNTNILNNELKTESKIQYLCKLTEGLNLVERNAHYARAYIYY